MKKILLTLVLAFSLFTLAGCTTELETEVRVLFYTNGGTAVADLTDLENNSLIPEPATEPVKRGSVFIGWFKDVETTEPWDFDVDKIGEETIVLYAGYSVQLLNITYELNGGEMINDTWVTQFYPDESLVLPLAKQEGYVFKAWYLEPWEGPGTTKPGDPGYQVTPSGVYEDVTLYAHWDPVTVSVRFYANYPGTDEGPSNPSPRSVEYGLEIDWPVLDDTATYRFVGWNSNSSGTGTMYLNGDIFTRTQRTSVYAVWELIE